MNVYTHNFDNNNNKEAGAKSYLGDLKEFHEEDGIASKALGNYVFQNYAHLFLISLWCHLLESNVRPGVDSISIIMDD